MTERPGKFLTAEWRHLAMFNFACDPAVLAPLVPAGTELDDFDGRTLVSLVGFLFLNTRLRGMPIPFHRNFEEVNLRFYVRRKGPEGWRRGVVFVKEIVPRRAIAAIARTVYNENYVALPMRHRVELDDAGALRPDGILAYAWGTSGRECGMRCRIAGPAETVPQGAEAEFITEHYWGYVRRRDGGTTEYEVEHPRWRVHPVKDASTHGDFAALYGARFAEALSGPPASAFVADGSPITVRRGMRV